ncbi:MAG: hypothetical protein ACE5DL_06275 [Nitrosopumilaceae archaeon]
MKYGFVLIQFDEEMERTVLDQLKLIPDITEIIDPKKQGELLIKVESDSMRRITNTIVWKIQKMTCINFVSPLSKNKNFFLPS